MVKHVCVNSQPTSNDLLASKREYQPVDQEEECISFSLQNMFLDENNINNQVKQNRLLNRPRVFSQEINCCDGEINATQVASNYRIQERSILGRGANAVVYQGINVQQQFSKIQNNKQESKVAIKEIKTPSFAKEYQTSLEKTQNMKCFQLILNEVDIMYNVKQNINSHYFVKIEEAYLHPQAKQQYIYTELCEQGTLEQHYQKMNLSQSIFIFQQIVQGVKQLHDQRIIHRDLKLANIYFKNQGIKIGDFGFAQKFPNEVDQLHIKRLGTAVFDSPEILLKKQDYYTLENDIFSLGVILHLLVHKKYPYLESQEKNDLRERLERGERVEISMEEFNKNSNNLVEDLLNKMLQIDPDQRIKWEQLMNHPVINMSPNNLIQVCQIDRLIRAGLQVPQQFREFYEQSVIQIQKLQQQLRINDGSKQNQFILFRELSNEERRLINKKNIKQQNCLFNGKYKQLLKNQQFKMIIHEEQEKARMQKRKQYLKKTFQESRSKYLMNNQYLQKQ